MAAEAQQFSSTEASTTAAEVLGGAPAPETVEAPKPPDRLAPKFQALLRRERTAVDRERTAKTQEDSLQIRLKDIEDRELRIKEFESIKEKNPTKALELLGLSYQDLTQILLAEGTIPAEVEVKRVEGKLNDFLKNQELAEQRRLQDEKLAAEQKESQLTNEFKSEIANYIQDNSERYELIAFEQSQELVYDVIDGHYERTKNPETGLGEILTIAQGADKVEEFLEKKYDKARTLKKMQALLAPRQETNAPKPKPTDSQKPKTLTNSMSATQMPQRTGPITDEERIRRAIAYAKSLTR